MLYSVQAALRPTKLTGLSPQQIEQHWNLYEGYVTQVNALVEELRLLRQEGKGTTLAYADRRRRLGFEYNGMVLHEYYFGNLKASGPAPGAASPLRQTLTAHYGSFEAFIEDFVRTGASRSIGWAILYLDPVTGALSNHFVQLHEDGNIAGFVPLLVMDVWEHAYMVDYGAGGRLEYIQTFIHNVNWEVVERRFVDAKGSKIPHRW